MMLRQLALELLCFDQIKLFSSLVLCDSTINVDLRFFDGAAMIGDATKI